MRRRVRIAGRRRAALAAAMTGAALLGTTLLAATPAQASSYDCVRWNPPTTAAPAGVYCFGVDVSGRQVSDTYGNYYFTGISFHPALYHEQEVVRFYGKKNANYYTFTGPAHPGWRFGNQSWTTPIHGLVRPGRVCGSLRAGGKAIATICDALS